MTGSKKRFYYAVARILHWVAALMIIFNLWSGWRLGSFPLATKQWLVMLHSGIGTTIFFLTLFRWWWRKSHKLYTRPGWWRRPSLLLQVSFYPLLFVQVITGVVQAAFIDYEVLAFGYINYSAIAPDNEGVHGLFLLAHGLTAGLLIVLSIIHALEPSSVTE